MKRLGCLFVLLLAFALVPAVWAGPEEEIREAVARLARAVQERNLDAFMAQWADNATFYSVRMPFRVEGKMAIRAFFERYWETYPTIRNIPYQASIQVYDGTFAAETRYVHQTLVDRGGKVTTAHFRMSRAWVKQGGRWMIVHTHNSILPASP